jgi:hypothetical protein
MFIQIVVKFVIIRNTEIKEESLKVERMPSCMVTPTARRLVEKQIEAAIASI